jgi:hypothetical protein
VQTRPNKAVIKERTFLLLPMDIKEMESPPTAVGVHSQHRFVYGADGTIRSSSAACGCDSCCVGSFDDCTQKSMVPPLVPAVLKEKGQQQGRAGGGVSLAGAALRQVVHDRVLVVAKSHLDNRRRGKASVPPIISMPEVRAILRALGLEEPAKGVAEDVLLGTALELMAGLQAEEDDEAEEEGDDDEAVGGGDGEEGTHGGDERGLNMSSRGRVRYPSAKAGGGG